MRRRGRPVLGALSGFFSGFFIATTLLFFGVIPLDSIVLVVLPVVFAIVVPLIAIFAPIGGSGPASVEPTKVPIPEPAASQAEAPAPAASDDDLTPGAGTSE